MKIIRFALFLSVLGFFGSSALTSKAEAVEDAGAKIYGAKCVSCHRKDGKGNPSMAKMFKVDSSALDVTAGKKSDEEILKIITDGKNKMPAYSKQLKADEIKSVVQYVGSLAPKKTLAPVTEKTETPVPAAEVKQEVAKPAAEKTETPAAEVKQEAAKPGVPAVSEEAKATYAKSCSSCHGKDGKGNAAMTKAFKVELASLNLADAGTLGKSDAELIRITTDGLNKMPGYKGKIADKVIAEIVSYLRSLQ